MATDRRTHEVVIVGGGFGGLSAAKALRDAPVHVTLLDRTNHHLFQPLLYQVATGALSPANIAAPLRTILRKQRNTRVLLAEVQDIDVTNRRVLTAKGEVPYDTLIVATGARHHYFGNEHWAPLAPGLKTIADATDIRRRVLSAFEAAEQETDPRRVQQWLTFVVVGGGPTGVELAGALGEIANDTLRSEFRSIDPTAARILLLEGLDQVLPSYPPDLAQRATRDLERLGVTVRPKTLVTAIEPGEVTVRSGEREERIEANTVLWAAGVQASSLGRRLAEQTGAELDRAGRVHVQPNLTLPGHPEIHVIGDLAHLEGTPGKLVPGLAAVAVQQGNYVAKRIAAAVRGEPAPPPFHYRDKGSLATIGRGAAVADFGRIRLKGLPGWLAWLGIHLMLITRYENRVLVLVQWAWSYWTRNRSARLIVRYPATPEPPPSAGGPAEGAPAVASGDPREARDEPAVMPQP